MKFVVFILFLFCSMTLCSLVSWYSSFGETCFFYLYRKGRHEIHPTLYYQGTNLLNIKFSKQVMRVCVCMCVCVCMYVCIYIYIYIYIHIHTFTNNNPLVEVHFCDYSITVVGRYTSVRIVTRYGLNGPGFESRRGEIFRTCPDRPLGTSSLL